jgi:hypothetical protein
MNNAIAGFSKLSKKKKSIDCICLHENPKQDAIATIKQYWNSDEVFKITR